MNCLKKFCDSQEVIQINKIPTWERQNPYWGIIWTIKILTSLFSFNIKKKVMLAPCIAILRTIRQALSKRHCFSCRKAATRK